MDELRYLCGLVAKGRMSRRDFLGRSAALGVSVVAAGSLLSTAARAEGPVRGGTIKVGMQGGASTDSLDPGLATNQVTAMINHLWGETLVWLAPDGSPIPVLADEWSASSAKTWTFKYAMDRETMIKRILLGYGSIGNDTPINKAYPLFDEIEQRNYDPEKAAFHFKRSGHYGSVLLRTSEVAFPGAVDAAMLYQQSAKKAGIEIEVRREPSDGYWSSVWNRQPFSTSYWGGRPTQDQMFSTGYISTADWNDTHFKNAAFDKMLVTARAELDEVKRRDMYRDMSMMIRDEGGAIVPMFNDFIDGASARILGWVDNPAGELMNGDAPLRCWLSA